MTYDPMKNLPGGIEGKVAAYLLKFVPKEAFIVEERREKFPDEPWLWEMENITKIRLPESANHVQTGWFIAFFLSRFPWIPVMVAESNKIFTLYPWSQVFLLLPLAGLFSIPWAIYRTLQAWIFSKAQLCLDWFPVASGTTLDGIIRLPTTLRLGDRVKLTLTCHESITTGSGKSKQTATNPLWTQTQDLTWSRDEGNVESLVPVHFDLPQNMEGTTEPDTLYQTSQRKVHWTLLVTAAIRGINLRALFNLPIYRTKDSPPLSPPDYTHITWQSLEAELSNTGIFHTEATIGRHVLKTQVPRSFSPLLTAVIALPIVGFGAYYHKQYSEIHGSSYPYIYMIVIFLFIVAGIFRNLFFAERVDISREGLVLRAGTLGFRRARFYAPEDIASLSLGYVQSSGKRCNIQLKTVQGQETVLLHALPNRAVAEDLIALISATLEIPTASTEDLA